MYTDCIERNGLDELIYTLTQGSVEGVYIRELVFVYVRTEGDKTGVLPKSIGPPV